MAELDKHARRVRAVADQVVKRPNGVPLTVRKNTHSHSPHNLQYKKSAHPVDVSALDNIISIDEKEQVVHCEGQVNMGQLVAATLARGFVIPCVPEYRSFTVAGLINGFGVQSSSHKYGLFNDSVLDVEVVKTDGEIVVCSPKKNADLFDVIHGSYGTIALVVGAHIRLIPAKPFVRSTYHHFTDLDKYVAKFKSLLGKPTYLDCVVFGPKHMVIVEGDFVDAPQGLPVFHPEDPDNIGEEYYYQYARRTKQRGITSDVIHTQEYLHRSQRGAYWVMEAVADTPLLNDTYRGRKWLDAKSKEVMEVYGFSDPALTTEERERCLVMQDMGIDWTRLKDGILWVQKNLQIYPIWNCAIRRSTLKNAVFSPKKRHPSEHVVDIGLYGEPGVKNYANRRLMRELQKFVDVPSVWGVSYLTREELRQTYDYQRYMQLRERFVQPGALKHVEDKVSFYEPGAPEQGPIPCWRLLRTWRFDKPVFFVVMLVYLLVLLMVAGILYGVSSLVL